MKINFIVDTAERDGYEALCVGWHTKTYIRSLAECGDAKAPANQRFVEWLVKKLKLETISRDHLFLKPPTAPPIHQPFIPQTISTPTTQFLSAPIYHPKGPLGPYTIICAGAITHDPLPRTKLLATLGNASDARAVAFAEWLLYQLSHDDFRI